MPISDPELWEKIFLLPLPFRAERDGKAEPPRDCAEFWQNVRKDGDWTDASARLLVEEYRRFLYLKARHGGTLTPPEVLDRVWHLHMEIDYAHWSVFFRGLGHGIYHQTGLDQAAALKAYERLIDLHRAEFDQTPSPEVWPSLWLLKFQPIRRRLAVSAWWLCGGSFGAALLAALVLAMVEEGVPGTLARLVGDGSALATVINPLTILGLVFLPVALMLTGFSLREPARIARCG